MRVLIFKKINGYYYIFSDSFPERPLDADGSMLLQ